MEVTLSPYNPNPNANPHPNARTRTRILPPIPNPAQVGLPADLKTRDGYQCVKTPVGATLPPATAAPEPSISTPVSEGRGGATKIRNS